LCNDISRKDETCSVSRIYAVFMNPRYTLAAAAALVADPGRAAMLTALLDGGSLPAGELARVAGVSAQSASMHLGQLVDGGFLTARQQGRHRYYSIATPEVAHVIEALSVVSTQSNYKPGTADQALCYARTCYDHLAGVLGVNLAAAFERKGLIVPRGEVDYELTGAGESFLDQWQIDTSALRLSRRTFARRCRDWTEKKDHLAGALGAAICQKLLEFRWITRDRRSRAVHISLAGRRHLEQLLPLPRI
jgi:DNA-binding transcriptional ArsR family regulator